MTEGDLRSILVQQPQRLAARIAHRDRGHRSLGFAPGVYGHPIRLRLVDAHCLDILVVRVPEREIGTAPLGGLQSTHPLCVCSSEQFGPS